MKLLSKIKHKITGFMDSHTSQIFDVNQGKLKDFPKPIIWMVYLMSLNVLLQGIFDVLIKFIGYTPWFVEFPWRMDFLFLTAISVLMGYQTLIGMRRRELDVTKNSVQVGILVEIALIVGDIYFIILHQADLPEALPVRLPFILLTSINVGILFYISRKLRLFRNGWL
jgi:hypothetical protein